MTKAKLLKIALGCSAAPAMICASSAHAGGLLSLLTKPLSTVTGKVSSTTAQTTTVLTSTVVSVVPLPKGVQDTVTKTLNPVVVTVSTTPGTVINTVNATGTIVENTLGSGLPYLLPNSAFEVPHTTDIEPKWGKIRSFQGGEVSPFWGKIRSFWGDTSPFEGNTAVFWGDLQTFNDGSDPGATAPQWGKIRSFWDELGGSWGTLRPVWDSGNYSAAAAQLRSMVDRSGSFWGDAVQASTGKGFNAGFADGLLGRYGIDLNNPSSLAQLSANEREHFFLEWYDGLMQFSGADNPDYWMRLVNWSPKLTQTAGEGRDSVIGLLDFTVSSPDGSRIRTYDGVSAFDNGHGAAVASLMVAQHDGKGVMGIAPQSKVVAYNPFDATGTAGWSDIRNGIVALGSHNASIINMSLGVPGWTLHPDWNSVFADPAVALTTKGAVFVIAAGNDGITQSQNIKWSNSANVIVVGSVDPNSQISEFSNRPGSACLTTTTGCDKLMNRFIVAPGEMMLVSDGQGGVTRYSGTSFAAPLVSGTVSLIHDRWPWLAQYPAETIDIVLKTAKDLGAPGVDPVYGAGMLDVTAALSPIDYNRLTWYRMDDKGNTRPMSSGSVRSSGATQLKSWEAAGMYFHAFETIGGSYRDFAIPLSSKLVDSTVLSAGSSREQFQAYLYNQVIDWMKTGASFAERPSLNYTASSASVPNVHGLNIAMSMAPRTLKAAGFRQGQVPYQSSLRLTDASRRFALKLGEGDGAVELGNSFGFGRAADYDRSRGGANPLLGMASGGAYAQVSYALSDRFSLSAGLSEQRTRYDRNDMSWQEASALTGLEDYRSGASTFSLTYRPAEDVELTGAYTRLSEQDAILGVQALTSELMDGGATTDGFTMGAAWQVTPTLQIAASATTGRTRAGANDTPIATGAGGLRSSAYQVTISGQQLFSRHDALRVSLAQPLHVDGGSFDISSLQVIDRQTGDLGLVTERFQLPGSARPLVAEFEYARSLMDGQADLALFGKAQIKGEQPVDETATVMAGARFRLRY